MQWTSAVSDDPSLEAAIDATSTRLAAQLGNAAPDLVVGFVSPHHAADYARVPELVARRFPQATLLGCSAGGVIGAGKEVEHRPGVSLTAAVLPGVELTPLRLDDEQSAPCEALARSFAGKEPHFVLLPDPFSFDAEGFLRDLDATFPGSTKIGGLASGGSEPRSNALYLGRATHRTGLVGLALTGNIAVDTIVAQGCRPIGEPMFVTRAEEHTLIELDGRAAVAVLQDLYRRSNPHDQELFRQAVFLGIVMNPRRQEYQQGDFLIRNIVGMEPSNGALAIGGTVEPQMVVQFHLRDKDTSARDLDELLGQYRMRAQATPPVGSLLFSCLGRGSYLYGEPDHDTDVFRRHLGDVPLGGFFCNGEIGPVHGTTFLHGYTSSFGLFRPR
jgi:small ligand-binding sensory domain FIST